MISIILPCYNQASYLPKMLKSINKQTDKNYELIIINDGCTDNTSDILKAFIFYKTPIILHSLVNQGLAKSLDIGHNLSSCAYITWVSCDGWLEPNFVEEFNKVQHCDICQAKFNVYKSQIFAYEACYSHLADPCHMQNLGAAFVYRRSVWNKIKYGDFEEGFEDGMFYLLCRAMNFTFKFIDKVLYNYIIQPNSISARAKVSGYQRYNNGLKIVKSMFPDAECWSTIKEYPI